MPSFVLQVTDQLSTSLALQIFSASTSILILALIGLVWARAVRWSFLDTMPLNRVEFDHPHLPSMRVLGFQLAACLCLIVAVIVTTKQPHLIVKHLGPVLLVATISIASELHSLRARIHGLALNLGTAIGMGIASIFAVASVASAISSLLLTGAIAILLAAQIQNRNLVRHWPLTAHLLLLVSAGLWILFTLS